ncbi:DUF6009 family protein [Streptomyces sp. NPDC057280]|uniref:DUF6009 family protein n=1 Tax=Streptomyces sp. NPDC057280 TaxID=3346081 RepID=UPI003629D861
MSSMLQDAQLVDEAEVVWLEEPDNLDYVRQALDKVSTRRGRPRYDRDGRMVGYTNLKPGSASDPDSGLFARRVFFLLPHDRDTEPDGPYAVGAPGEAVDPGTLEAGKAGEKTTRSQGRSPQIAPAGR